MKIINIKLKLSLWGLSLLACSLNTATSFAQQTKQPNILMIAVDDLNHWVGHLGRNSQVKTPNIDKLAAKGLSFHRAYSPSAICNATRSAMMTGLRPNTSGVYKNGRDWRSVVGPNKSLPAFFKKNGYSVMGAGKIFHNDRVIYPQDWHYYLTSNNILERYRLSADEQAKADQIKNNFKTDKYKVGKLSISQIAAGDDTLWDYHVARWAADQVSIKHEKPFFIAAGIFRPHLPWHVPKAYFDMYPLDEIELPPYLKDDLEDLAKTPTNTEEHDMILKEKSWRKAIQGYLASITYADTQVGRILDALEQSPNKDNTIVVLWGDHGWHLGEKHRWRKFELWEESTRTPYVWYVPGVTKPNSKTDTPVDLQSLWPTLAELTNTKAPDFVEGTSVLPLLKNPNMRWTVPALTTQGYKNHAVRLGPYRYIQYRNGGEEFYDHTTDPYEWYNKANTEEYAKAQVILKSALPKLNREWESAAKLYGGQAKYNKLKPSKMVTDY
ncbi:sulfatase [Catenovulum adriaticum]|uniref:Sulfatase n=1 Tax=Catenovulum adriaticum TaxID=2984846 RepID=A0ABY7AQD6_9ALTE|nr:sulfatase [Catenovulum sp. TS8]WAJ71763.1 sulfatase [Catenovulum sp. TS8]